MLKLNSKTQTQEITFSSLEESDIAEVIKIQSKNKKHDIPASDFENVGRGYLSWESTEDALKATLDKKRSIVAKNTQGKIVAFLLTVDLTDSVPALFSQEMNGMVQQLLAINNGSVITHKVCCGQIWKDSDYFKEEGKSYVDNNGKLLTDREALDIEDCKKVPEVLYDIFFDENKGSQNPYAQRIAIIVSGNGQSYNFHTRYLKYKSLGLERFSYENEEGRRVDLKHVMVKNLPS